jgi:hypothetical protein
VEQRHPAILTAPHNLQIQQATKEEITADGSDCMPIMQKKVSIIRFESFSVVFAHNFSAL